MKQENILNTIEEASKVIGKTWPLYSFVTSNPLSGYESLHFKDAVLTAKKYLNAAVFPKVKVFQEALDSGEINTEVLSKILNQNELLEKPEYYITQMTDDEAGQLNPNHVLDRIMAKWLAAFLDEGLAEWQMPGKKDGFYLAWRKLAKYDSELQIKSINEVPKSNLEALAVGLEGYPQDTHLEIYTQHLAALPGWIGYINYRTQENSPWQKEYPISQEDYLAVRLFIAKKLKINALKESDQRKSNENNQLKYLFLKAWEQSWQKNIVAVLPKEEAKTKDSTSNPDAQLVFCIDTRSELIRRHVEAQGNYETFGYAGFFGIAMDYTNLQDGITRKSCPPIVGSAYEVKEVAQLGKDQQMATINAKHDVSKFEAYFLKRMKNMLPSTFGFVEGSGLFYGISLVTRTLSSGFSYRFKKKSKKSFENDTTPQINCSSEMPSNDGIPLEDKVAIVKSAFDLTGWKNFAPIVVFAGHGSHTANNPFASSLDCGACAASPGRHNARMLAKLANLKEVREVLVTKHKFDIPKETVFVGAEHNTTTDEIELFDAEVPNSYQDKIQQLKADLKKAQITATRDRLGVQNSVSFAEKKANDWGETRPEWGLAKNAGFIVAPREITKKANLDSRCFLHSYDWEQDVTGQALEGIMQGPMVVTQWINNHYYFTTVDNNTFGGGSKITHNVTGTYGVVQGNGGDLKMGLPLQSLFETDAKLYHQPLRLSVLIKAPLPRVIDILSRNKNLKALLDNEWIHLLVMDPLDENNIRTYQKDNQWSGFEDEQIVRKKKNENIVSEEPVLV